MNTGQFDTALELITSLTRPVRQIRSQIPQTANPIQGKYQNTRLPIFSSKLEIPQEESIIFADLLLLKKVMISKSVGNSTKIRESDSSSRWAQVSLFKYYLEKKTMDQSRCCYEYRLKVAKSIIKIKHRIL
jgi:hypothetical protein